MSASQIMSLLPKIRQLKAHTQAKIKKIGDFILAFYYNHMM